MVWSSLAPKWPLPIPFCGIDRQKSNFSLISDTLSVRGCWGQPMSFFWKLVDETQISAPLEATRHHKSKKILVLLSLRANLKIQFRSETPCTYVCTYGCSHKYILSTYLGSRISSRYRFVLSYFFFCWIVTKNYPYLIFLKLFDSINIRLGAIL